MQKITILEDKTSEGALRSPENVQVSVQETESQTFPTLDNKGEVTEISIEVLKPAQSMNLKDVDGRIDTLNANIAQTQKTLTDLQDTLLEMQILRSSVDLAVANAIAAYASPA